MSDFNTSLERSLSILYGHAGGFKMSIELIQKLSQQLNLDTFIDTDAYSHIIDQPYHDESGNSIKFQRLSIAGSLILIDIDFLDSVIYRVSFSSANQLYDNKLSDINSSGAESNTKSPPTVYKQDNINVIKLTFAFDSVESILDKKEYNNIEVILLKSLQAPKLMNFPRNLKYLAKLDRLSNTHIDAFTYVDNAASILKAIYSLETQASVDWLIEAGYSNSIGKPCINKPWSNDVGIFLEFWEDFRYINHEYQQEGSGLLLGQKYSLLFDLDQSTRKSPTDFIGEARDHIWEFNGEKYQLQFGDNTYLTTGRSSITASTKNDTSFTSNWAFNLVLSHPIYLPINIIEFIGIESFEESDFKDDTFFDKLNVEKDFYVHSKVNKGLKFSIKSDIHSKFVSVRSLSIKTLRDIPLFIRIFRNQIVLTNILKQLIWSNGCKIGGEVEEEDKDFEAKSKLKNSLSLANLDDQLLSLHVLNKSKFTETEETDLDEFMNEESPFESDAEEGLVVKISEMSYNTKNLDTFIEIFGKFNDLTVDIHLKISNGEIVSNHINSVMDDEAITQYNRFIKCLNITEDIVKSLNHVYPPT